MGNHMGKGKTGKRMTALLLSAALFLGSISFSDLYPVFAAAGQDISWTREALDAAAAKGYIPTGLAYRTSTSAIKPEFGFMGEKQYLHGSGKYSEFANRYIYCINLHKDNGGKLLYDSQAFHSGTYNIDKLPVGIIKGASNEQRKFNFLVIVYAASYQAEQEAKTLEPPNANVGVDILTVCSPIIQNAADNAVFTGDWETDFAWFKSVIYPLTLASVGPVNTMGDAATYRRLTSADIPEWAREKGCANRAQAIFCYIWTAAKLSSHVELNNGKDIWKFKAGLEEDGLYHVRIPFDGENQYITEYLRVIRTECYGDWQKQEDASCLHFISPTGQTPSGGSIAKLTYADSEGMIARNLSEAKLYEFKFYTTGNRETGFDNVQSYFSAIMDQDLEIYLVTGDVSGGSADVEVNRYEHEESWNADYNVRLIKYDSETGKPLQGARFDILEAFDDSQLDETALDMQDGAGADVSAGTLNSTAWGDDSIESNYNGETGLPETDSLLYNWANEGGSQFERWEEPEEDPCIDDSDVTDSMGRLTYQDGTGKSTGEEAHSDVRSYTYHKGYCDGHPAPVIQYEELEDEESEKDGDDGGEDVEAYNQQLHDETWAAWYAEVETCLELMADGGFFHAIEPEIAREAMEADRDRFYEDFISLTYDYSARELESRKGYILHGLHGDDVEIEWRTVTSSQYKDFVKNGLSRSGDSGDGDNNIRSFKVTPESELITVQTKDDFQGEDGEEEKFLFIDEDGGRTSASSSGAKAGAYSKASPSDADMEAPAEAPGMREAASPSEMSTPSEASTPSGASTPSEAATSSEALRKRIALTGFMAEQLVNRNAGIGLYALWAGRGGSIRKSISFEESQAETVEQGERETVDWTFILYDHRTEGEVHIRKQDLDLNKGKNDTYDSYGDTQGDSTLEGAVYGLFAAADIEHPDGKTGVVFKRDELVAMASTDKNGDASFPAITEAPGTHFNFDTGTLERPEAAGPENLYTGWVKADAVQDNERFEGHSGSGHSLALRESTDGDGTGYRKLTSNQGVDGTGDGGAGYRIQNNEANNGNCWIGRPLIISREGSRYYIMELSRSEGYELSRYGADADVTNREADAAGDLPSAEGTVRVSELEMNRKGAYNQFSVFSKDAANGYDIAVTGLRDGAKFYTVKTEIVVNPDGTHTELVPVKEPVYGTPGNQVIINGKAVEASVGDIVALPNGGSVAVQRISDAPRLLTGVRPGNAFQVEPPEITGEEKTAVEAEFIQKVNKGLKKAGYKTPEEGSPWLRVALDGSSEKGWCEAVNDSLKNYRVFNAFLMEDVVQENGVFYGIVRYSYLQAGISLPALYDETGRSVWIRKTMTYQKGGKQVAGYLYFEYPSGSYDITEKNAAGFVTAATVRRQSPEKDTASWGDDLSNITLKDNLGKQYWVYAEHEQAYDNKGNLVYNTRYESEEAAPGYEEKVTEALLDGTCDRDTMIYTVHVAPELIPDDGRLDFRIRYDEEFVDGGNTSYPDYVQGNAIVSVSPASSFHDAYIENVLLTCPGKTRVYQDAGTREHPVPVFERIIRQKVKIIKDIETTPEGAYAHNTNAGSGHQDSFTTGPGGVGENADKLPNFRFKIYLKSNLERLYRNEEGGINWIDRNGNEINIEDYQASYPETEPFGSVQKLYTKVPHKTDSLTTGSVVNNTWDEAVTANGMLYPFDADGRIEENQNAGYTRLLETVTRIMEDGAGKTRRVEGYNYDKFFEAVRTANHDKWDRNEDASTSFKPLAFIRRLIFGTNGGEKESPVSHNNSETENQANTSEEAKENAKRSDAVRQFAINWYLEEEAKKLTEDNGHGESQASGGGASYQDKIYDQALYAAILKAENYLSPFFTYDLDEIYAVAWDGEADGGRDGDRTTLSADTLFEAALKDLERKGNGLETSKSGACYGVSKYLPYGAYVVVEQQPYNAELGDFYNKHYKTDQPKEIVLPALYEEGGNEGATEVCNRNYQFNSEDTPEELQKKYYIRVNEEWKENHPDDLRNYVIRAHNNDGDFEIYKYGLAAGKLAGRVTYPGGSFDYKGFSITQEEFNPYKDVYKTENAASVYRSNERVGTYYRYASVSEQSGTADNVPYQSETAVSGSNPSGFCFKDGVKTITGVLTGYEGKYFSALVPWTVTEPADAGGDKTDGFTGYADGKYRNTFYASKLRIEKLDSETGETVLHDGAIFSIYSADREDGEYSGGRVKFYEKDTVIAGSREFLEAMGASGITPLARPSLPWQVPYNGKYYGTVPAGTPICREKEVVMMTDEAGEKTGQFRAFTTTGDRGAENGSQNVGYLETPQPLGAGCYVLCEIKAPAGYVRSRPVAVEIYSDEIAYYLNGISDNRVLAAIYEDGTETNKDKPQDRGDTAGIYLNNTPIRLEVTKKKPEEDMVTYELKGRLEGSITELKGRYGLENLELACTASGKYLGYGWKKGFLDSLKKKQEAGESIEILYEDGGFTGNARLFKVPETADDVNRYLPGAVMTLFDAVEVRRNGDREDYQFDGVNVERDRYGNVNNMYVQKGFAGTRLRFVLDKTKAGGDGLDDYRNYTYDDQENDKGAGTWIYKTVEREDTDILFYDLGGLTVLQKENGALYGFDGDGRKIRAKNGSPLFALKNGTPFLEIISQDYETLRYNAKDRVFDRVPEGTQLYHLDAERNRDSQVDPYTGMAYVVEENTGKILVWPVKISRDQYGNVTAREKITTSRIAAIEADTEREWTVGTMEAGRFKKTVNPVLNEYGQPVYYQKSGETYQKGSPVYDRDGDYIRYRYDDKLKEFNDNAWRIDKIAELMDIGFEPEAPEDDRPLYHRQGESYIMENTWTTGESAPNDPFQSGMTDGRVDVLKRVPAGLYIMEELKAPEGYVKAMPAGVTVEDKTEVQAVQMTDRPISGYLEKVDAPEAFRVKVRDCDKALDEAEIRTEGKASYSYGSVKGARLALFRARRVVTDDLNKHPSGFYLEKAEETPARWTKLDENNRKKTFVAEWVSGDTPEYLEAIPKGFYILEEISAPAGFVRSSMELEIKEKEGLQHFLLPNDHTKAEIYKYMEMDGRKHPVTNDNPAEFAVYDGKGELFDQWTTDDCAEYTSTGLSGFTYNYQRLFKEYGTAFDELSWDVERTAARDSASGRVFRTSTGFKIVVGQDSITFQEGMDRDERERFIEGYRKNENALTVSWLTRRTAHRLTSENTDKNESVRQIWQTDTGSKILICSEKNLTPEGKWDYLFDYKFNYKKIRPAQYPGAVSYDTPQGNHRMDYIPQGQYRLVELRAPEGFAGAAERIITIEDTADIQLYSVENKPRCLYVEKHSEDGKGLAGAELALYCPDDRGNFSQEPEYLQDSWISGEEGNYTEEDYHEGKIPEGFKTGDMKPHRIEFLGAGTYYLAEIRAPEGFETMEPQKVEIPGDVQGGSPIRFTAVNRIKKGSLLIEKADAEDNDKKLPGAKFEVKNKSTGERYLLVTDENGRATLSGLVTGALRDGRWTPYQFAVRELAPPELYALSMETTTFSFTDSEGSRELTYKCEINDEPTDVLISKTDFESNEFVKGARLAVYRAVEEDGTFAPSGEPLEEWISDGKKHRITGKLSAGGVYFLIELEAPGGYIKSPPILFVFADDGRKISSIRDQERIIDFKTSGLLSDAVESVSVQGRRPVSTEIWLTHLDTGKIYVIPSYQTAPLTRADGLTDGGLYEEKEIIRYTDGNSRITGRQIFRMSLNAEGEYRPKLRMAEKTLLKLETESGGFMEEWEVENREGSGYRHVIQNPVYEEKNVMEVVGENGKNGSSVQRGSVVRYGLTCKNTQKTKRNVEISVTLDPQLEYMPGNSDKRWNGEKNGKLTMILENMAPGEEKNVLLAAAVKTDAETAVSSSAEIGGVLCLWKNPVAGEGSLAVVSRLTGTAASLPEGGTHTYTVELYDENGQPLKGSFRYTGDEEGSLKSGGRVELGRNESIVITGLPWGTLYKITPSEPEDAGSPGKTFGTEGTIGRKAASAVFVYRENDASVREFLKRGDVCHLTETTLYANGSSLVTGKLTFTLDESAAAGGLDMKDQPVRVLISKTDLTGGTELPGAEFCLRDKDGRILDEWVSDGKPHETDALLRPGEKYCLSEEKPPDGYAAAEDICFTVPEDGAETTVIVNDRPTRILVLKNSAQAEANQKGENWKGVNQAEVNQEGEYQAGINLAGAELEIIDSEGKRIETWISDGTVHVLEGKLIAGETYTLRELAAPPGYRIAEPVSFTVSEDGREDTVIMEDEPTRLMVEKIGCEADGKTETGRLAGALIRIEDKRGREVYRFLTREDGAHEITGILRAGETYTAVEEEPPYGYEYAEPVTFSIPEEDEVVWVKLIDRKKAEPPHERDNKKTFPGIAVRKYDGVTLKGLAGAVFAVYRSDGSFLLQVHTGEDGRAEIKIHEPGTYTLVETKAPPGYKPSEEEYPFTVTGNESGRKELSVANYPVQETAGLITVHYDRKLKGDGNIFLKRRRLFPLPMTGDGPAGAGELALVLILLGGTAMLWMRRRQWKKPEKKGRR